MEPIKRFVAGAVCPRCGEMDRLRTWRDELKEYRECIDCQYQDAMRLDGSGAPQELATRVNQARPQDEPAGEQVLTFVPMKKTAPAGTTDSDN